MKIIMQLKNSGTNYSLETTTKTLLALVFFLTLYKTTNAQVYMGEKCQISFFSETKLENIDATNAVSKPMLNTKNGAFAIKASQNAFIFKSAFMQEHYNENYMESEKYPFVTFTGKINEPIDYTVNAKNNVTITGTLDMHGVSKPRTISGTVEIKSGTIIMTSNFDVTVADHGIKVPSLYIEKIAEVVQVKFNAELVPFKKQ